MTRLAILVVGGAMLAGAAAADAAVYAGESTDGNRVGLRTNAQDKPNLVEFGEYEASCTHGWEVNNPITGFEPPFTSVSDERVVDRGRRRVRRRVENVPGKVRVRVRWNLVVSHTAADHWRGRFATTGVFRQHGETLSRCTTRFRFDLAPA